MNFILKETFKTDKVSYDCDLTILFNASFMPHSMMTVLYTIVCLNLWSRKVPGEGNNEEQSAALKIARKVTRIMIIVVVLYLICWLPVYMSVLLLFVVRVQVNDIFFLFTNSFGPLVRLDKSLHLLPQIISQNLRNGFRKLIKKLCGKLRMSNISSFRTNINAEPICF